MKKNINEAFSTEESKEIYDKFLSIVGTRRDNLVKRYGTGAEQVAYATAVNQVKKKAANKPKEPMENTKLREMIKSALLNPKAADLNKDGKLSDYEEKRGAAIEKNLNEENIGLADIEEMGYEAGERAFEEIKGRFRNQPDHQAYRKGFFQGYIDQAGAYGLNENEDKEPTKADLKATKGLAKAKEELAQLTKQMKSLARDYKEAEGAEKEKIVADLKKKTKLKRELEAIIYK